MTYTVVSITINSDDKGMALAKQVNTFLKNGWKLQGGISCSYYMGTFLWSQAMIQE